MFLVRVDTETYETFQTIEFENEYHKEDIDKVISALQKHCMGEVNVTYERYLFNKRTKEAVESFDSFLSDLRKLVHTCEYGTLEESITRDRIITDIRDDATRYKLLQTRELNLTTAVDIFKASEVATKQRRVMTSSDDVNAVVNKLNSETAHPHKGRSKSQIRGQHAVQKRDVRTDKRKCKF